MTTDVASATALKEWAAVIDAMAQGRQVLTLRKGGLREKAFGVQSRGFYLLPTYEHQAEALIKPAYREHLRTALDVQGQEQTSIVRARAELAGVWELDDAERLAAIEPFHMFTDGYAQARFDWRPKKPLTLLLLRVFRLAAPWNTGLSLGAGGCRSWIELDANDAPGDEGPALSDAEFAAQADAIGRALGLGE